jgi:nucleoprotein TPR
MKKKLLFHLFLPLAVSSNEQLQNKVNALSSTQFTSSAEASNLKHRIEDVEREKRDLVAVVGKLQGESADREEEITTLRGSLKQARQDLYTAESQVRELQSTEVSTKFRLESLTQQLELAQSETERNASELAAKSEELTKYRRTKHAELAELQIAHDALEQTYGALESSYKALQSTHASQIHQLQEHMQRVQDLTGQLAEQEATYTGEISGLKRLVAMLEARGEQAAKIVSDIENQWAGVGEVAERREATLREEIARERQAREEAEARVDRLETVLQRLETGELPVPSASAAPGTPGRDIVAESISAGIISPTVALASKVQRGGKTFGQVYQDYVQLQQELAIRNAEYDRMERTLTEVLNEIEQRVNWHAFKYYEYTELCFPPGAHSFSTTRRVRTPKGRSCPAR